MIDTDDMYGRAAPPCREDDARGYGLRLLSNLSYLSRGPTHNLADMLHSSSPHPSHIVLTMAVVPQCRRLCERHQLASGVYLHQQ